MATSSRSYSHTLLGNPFWKSVVSPKRLLTIKCWPGFGNEKQLQVPQRLVQRQERGHRWKWQGTFNDCNSQIILNCSMFFPSKKQPLRFHFVWRSSIALSVGESSWSRKCAFLFEPSLSIVRKPLLKSSLCDVIRKKHISKIEIEQGKSCEHCFCHTPHQWLAFKLTQHNMKKANEKTLFDIFTKHH